MDWRARARRWLPYVIALTAGFLVAYVIVFFFVFPSDVLPDEERRVPEVVGLTYDKARQRLERAGFTAALGESRFSTPPKMTVLEQDPVDGVPAKEGAAVILHVSAGPRTGTVPPVVGLAEQQARIALENAGFDIGTVLPRESTKPRGEVLEVTPAAGQAATLPATANLAVSGGPSTLDVPDLGGRQLPEARRTLEQLGLRLGPVTVDSMSLAAPNTVVGQTPGAGARVPSGSVVRVRIAPQFRPAPAAPDPAIVPATP